MSSRIRPAVPVVRRDRLAVLAAAAAAAVAAIGIVPFPGIRGAQTFPGFSVCQRRLCSDLAASFGQERQRTRLCIELKKRKKRKSINVKHLSQRIIAQTS